MHFPGRITSVVAALMTAAQLFSCSGPASEKDPVKEEPSVTPQPPSPGGQEEAKAPRADLLDVVFSSDGSARDVSAKGMSVRYVPGPALATYSNDTYPTDSTGLTTRTTRRSATLSPTGIPSRWCSRPTTLPTVRLK